MADNHTAVRPGQIYRDTDHRMGGRELTVVLVERQDKSEGRFKARYTYATCATPRGRKIKIDTDRLLSGAYRLVHDPVNVKTAVSA